MTSEQYRYLVGLTTGQSASAGTGDPTAGSYPHFMQGFDPFTTGQPLTPNQLSPNPDYTRAATDPGLFLDDRFNPLPRAAPVGTPGPVPQLPGNIPGVGGPAWAGTSPGNPANFIPGGNKDLKSQYNAIQQDLTKRMIERLYRDGLIKGRTLEQALSGYEPVPPEGQFGPDEPYNPEPPQDLTDRGPNAPPMNIPHEGMDVGPGVYPSPTPTDTPEPFEPPSMPQQFVYPDSTPAPNPSTYPDVRIPTDRYPSPTPSAAPTPTPPGGAPNVVNTMSPYPGAPPMPVMPQGPGLPGPTPGGLPSPPGEIPTYPNQTVYPPGADIPTFGNQVIYPDQPDVPTPMAPQGFDYTGFGDTGPGAGEFLYNPPVTGGEFQPPDYTGLPAGPAGEYLYNPPVTGAPPAPVSDAGVAPSGPTGSYPYLYNPPVLGPTGQPLDYTGLNDSINNATVTPVSLFGGDSGNTQASNFVPNPSGGYWGYDDNWNWVGDVAAPTEPAMTTAVNETMFDDEGNVSGSGQGAPVYAGDESDGGGGSGTSGAPPPAPGQGYDPNAPGGDYYNAETGGDMDRLQNEGAFGMSGPNITSGLDFSALGSAGDRGGFFGSTISFNPGGGDLSNQGGQVISSSVGPPQGGGGPPMWGPMMPLGNLKYQIKMGMRSPGYSSWARANPAAAKAFYESVFGPQTKDMAVFRAWQVSQGKGGGGTDAAAGGMVRGDLTGSDRKASRHTPTLVQN